MIGRKILINANDLANLEALYKAQASCETDQKYYQLYHDIDSIINKVVVENASRYGIDMRNDGAINMLRGAINRICSNIKK